ncbi:MAG TPA: molybdopterin-dependent oxidoreductase [Dehalococcoidia bacterium]|nr:molybdopterin-dependent oxidoreductase [Dehalococcoidia bacterium]
MRNAPSRSTWPALVGGAVAVAMSILARSIFGTKLLAEVFVDATTDLLQPKGFSTLLRLFDSAGKPMLFASVLIGEVLLFAVAWRLASRLPTRGRAFVTAEACAVLLLLTTLLLVAITDAGLGSRTTWPEYTIVTLAIAAAYALVAGGIELADTTTAGAADLAPNASRRQLLVKAPAILLGAGAVYVIGHQFLKSTGGGVKSHRDGEATPEVTATEDFYLISKNFIDPQISGKSWRLKAGGLVAKPMELSLGGVRDLPSVEQYATLQCISNEIGGELISNALWKGVPMSAFLDRLKPDAEARFVVFRSDDDYQECMPIDFARLDGVILAYEMNGEPLTEKHGFPLRLLAPGKYGMKQPKWIREIVLARDEAEAYWVERGWDRDALMNTVSRIDVPLPGREIEPGAQRIEGLAFSGRRGIESVEVSLDDGETWRKAELKAPLSPYTWVLWRYDWQDVPERGAEIAIVVRATDGAGALQSAEKEPPYPSGATGLHRAKVGVKRV